MSTLGSSRTTSRRPFPESDRRAATAGAGTGPVECRVASNQIPYMKLQEAA